MYELTCPACKAVQKTPFVRLGAVAVCPSCSHTYPVKKEYFAQVPGPMPVSAELVDRVLGISTGAAPRGQPGAAAPTTPAPASSSSASTTASPAITSSPTPASAPPNSGTYVAGARAQQKPADESATEPAQVFVPPTESPKSAKSNKRNTERTTTSPKYGKTARRRSSTPLVASVVVLVLLLATVGGFVYYLMNGNGSGENGAPIVRGPNPGGGGPITPPKPIVPATSPATPATKPAIYNPDLAESKGRASELGTWEQKDDRQVYKEVAKSTEITLEDDQVSDAGPDKKMFTARLVIQGKDPYIDTTVHLKLINDEGMVFATFDRTYNIVRQGDPAQIEIPIPANLDKLKAKQDWEIDVGTRLKDAIPYEKIDFDSMNFGIETRIQITAVNTSARPIKATYFIITALTAKGETLGPWTAKLVTKKPIAAGAKAQAAVQLPINARQKVKSFTVTAIGVP